MALELTQIREILKSPQKKNLIAKAIKHQNRLKLHTETYLDISEIAQPANEFLMWVKQNLPTDKYNIFLSLFRFPLFTNQVTGFIYNELERVFDGRNSSVNFQFTDSKFRDDWEYYRQDVLKQPEIWKDKGWKTLKTEVNSVLIVDLPKDQLTSTPEPYFYFLPIECVIDYQLTDKLEWIVFHQNDSVAVFCDGYFRILKVNSKNEITEVLSEVKHSLGYCPASFFWNESISNNCNDVKKAPITTQLSNLDWLLYYAISKRHLDLYAGYPIYSSYAVDCNYENQENGDICDGGFLRNQIKNHYYFNADGSLQKCPLCSSKGLSGPGSNVVVPVPVKDEVPDMKNPIQITTIDIDSLTYNVTEQNRLKKEIIESVVGIGNEVQNKQALNVDQVDSLTDSKQNILIGLKENFEKAMKFVNDTICKLRYVDNFLSSSINMGTEFFDYSVEELYKQYNQAKLNGSNESVLESLANQIIEVENRINPIQLQRAQTLKQLEPYPHYTRTEILTMNSQGLLDPILLTIKLNFNTFVDRFERENINITEFGTQTTFDQKIKTITETFKSYAKEYQTSTIAPVATVQAGA